MFDLSCNNGALRRKIKVTIEKIDFEHDGVPHSLQFHWVVDDGKERRTDMRYTNGLGRGLVSLDGDQPRAASRMAGRVKAGLAASSPRPRLQRPRSAWERAGV